LAQAFDLGAQALRGLGGGGGEGLLKGAFEEQLTQTQECGAVLGAGEVDKEGTVTEFGA
jgi:hypothetical protein